MTTTGNDLVSVIDTATNTIVDTITVGDQPDKVIVIDVPVTPTGADLSVDVSDSADPVALADTYTTTATVTNDGPDTATGVTAAIGLTGTGAVILDATSSQGSCSIDGSTVACSLGTLAPGADATVAITVEPQSIGTNIATSTVSALEVDPDPADNSDSEATAVDNAHGCTIIGTPGNDALDGTGAADVICGLAGNDTINGKGGNDVLYAGSGNDSPINGGTGNDLIYGGYGNDSTYGEGLLQVLDNGEDTLDGGPGDDSLDGQKGNDTLIDHDGTDSLSGSAGSDSIDVLDNSGGDSANGGLGIDTCIIDTGDTAASC